MECLKCSICQVRCGNVERLQKHIIRCHKFDPLFRVRCTNRGCGATFKKWASYMKHVSRHHPQGVVDVEAQEDHMDIVGEPPDAFDHNVGGQEAPALENAGERRNDLTTREKLNWHAAEYLLDIRENCKTSHVALEKIKSATIGLISMHTSNLLNEVCQLQDPDTHLIPIGAIQALFTQTFPPSMLFDAVSTKWYFDKFLIENMNMVCPEPLEMGSWFRWVKKKKDDIPHLYPILHRAYIVPFLENLRVLLMNEEIRTNITAGGQQRDGCLRTVLDGSYYQENEFFRDNENSLAVILYYDELGIANPLGSHSKAEKLCMFYWTLGNITPNVRSTDNAIQLLAVVKSTVLKQYGLHAVLEPFLADIKILENDGITINVNAEELNFKGSILFCAGDTPASAAMGGFKESVSAYRLCRSCMANVDDWKEHFDDRSFVPRDKITHQKHVDAVTTPNVPEKVINFWQRRYGVNGPSPVADNEFFDVTQCFPHDLLHLYLEGGVGEVSTRNLLHYLIIEKKLFTLNEFNERLMSFNFGHFKVNKPVTITREQLVDGTLKQSAAEMLGLLHTLPFLINEWITCDEDILEHMMCHIELLQIINVCFAYEIHIDTTDLLARMIELFIIKFDKLYPGKKTPKFHFMIHLCRYIRLFGPARQQWCFGFERAHNYFKALVPVVRNFRNMPYTLSYRHQARQCSRLATSPENSPKKFLYPGDEIQFGQMILLNNLPDSHLFDDYINEENRENCQLFRARRVKRYGTTYEPNFIILLEVDEDSLPRFGEIKEIFVINQEILILYTSLETLFYDKPLNAYRVRQPIQILHGMISMMELIFPHPIPLMRYHDHQYVLLLDNEHTEFSG